VIANSATDALYEGVHRTLFHLSVCQDGTVKWKPGGRFATKCAVDTSIFPFDKQVCEVRIANWDYLPVQVNLTNCEPPMVHEILESSLWDNLNITSRRMKGYTIQVIFDIHLTRRPLYYVINLLLPFTILSIFSLVVFWVPPDSGERLSLGVTILLSYTLFLLMVRKYYHNIRYYPYIFRFILPNSYFVLLKQTEVF
jgi:nicotinic acetylcholine receptor